ASAPYAVTPHEIQTRGDDGGSSQPKAASSHAGGCSPGPWPVPPPRPHPGPRGVGRPSPAGVAKATWAIGGPPAPPPARPAGPGRLTPGGVAATGAAGSANRTWRRSAAGRPG